MDRWYMFVAVMFSRSDFAPVIKAAWKTRDWRRARKGPLVCVVLHYGKHPGCDPKDAGGRIQG